MRDWIVGLEKAAQSSRPGATDFEWNEVESALGLSAPEELRDVYRQMNGAGFSSGVRLHPLRATDGKGVLEESQNEPGGWVFGERDNGAVLFAAPKAQLVEKLGADALPEWTGDLDDGTWLYAQDNDGESKVYKTLEHLLGVLVPPAQTEEYGDITYARAMTAVQDVLSELDSVEEVEETDILEVRPAAKPKVKKPTKAAKPVKAKAKPKKAGKKVSGGAKKAAKKATAKKKAPAKKAAKKPAPKRKKR